MKHDLAQLKRTLPLDALLIKLGHASAARKSAKCPMHADTRNSFSVYDAPDGEPHWRCHAGCGGGDVIDFVQRFFGLPDAKAAIERYAELCGNPVYTEAARSFRGSVRPAKAEPKPKLPPAKLQPLTMSAAAKIAKWRGLSLEFVAEMSDQGILGLYDSKPAFATEGGVQYRVPGDGWRFSPGASNSVLVLGEPAKDKTFFIAESNWDALAIHEASRLAVVCTRGAANARLAIEYVNEISKGESMNIACFPQNDKAGEEFAQNLRAGLMLHQFKIKRPPAPFKDFAEYHKDAKERLTINGRNI